MLLVSRYASTIRGTATSVRRLARSSARKPFLQIAREMVACYHVDGRFPRQYLLNQLYHPDVTHPHAYAAQESLRRLGDAGDRSPARLVLDDKLHFHQFYRGSTVPIPRLLGFCFQGRFFVGDRARQVGDDEAFREVALDLLARARGGIFAKSLGGSQGRGVYRLRPETPPAEVDRVGRALRGGAFVIEEEIVQHPDVGRIFPHSLNTVRIISGALPNGEVRTVSALIRFGGGEAYIDNASRGGVFASIDLVTGRVAGPARRFFKFGGGKFPSHPNTGVAIEGVTIPFFREAMAVTEEALRMLPSPVVGWDVGITPQGPILVEGNGHPHLVGAELAAGGYRENMAFMDLVNAY